jgi:hypothetical protein
MQELDRQGNAIVMARKATVVTTTIVLEKGNTRAVDSEIATSSSR